MPRRRPSINQGWKSVDKYPSFLTPHSTPWFLQRSPEGKRLEEWTEEGPLKIATSSLLNKFCLVVVFDFPMWAIFNVFVEFVTILLQFFFFFCLFWPQVMFDLSSPAGFKPILPALGCKVLATGPPGKTPYPHLNSSEPVNMPPYEVGRT